MESGFVKGLYLRELDDFHRHNSRATLYVAVLTVVGGLIAFCIRQFASDSRIWFYILLAVIAVAVVFYALTVIWVLRAMIGFSYERLPYATTLKEYYDEFQQYYRDNPEVEGSADEDFNAFLVEKMIRATTRNSSNNIIRSARFHRATCFLAIVISSSLLATILVIANVAKDQGLFGDHQGEKQHEELQQAQGDQTGEATGDYQGTTPEADSAGEPYHQGRQDSSEAAPAKNHKAGGESQ